MSWNTEAGGERVRAHHLASTRQRDGIPSQSWHATHHQWQDGSCDGFVTATQRWPMRPDADRAEAAAVAMGYWTEQDLPFYYGLARTFPLADRWFSSCLGPTFPNRRFLIAGTAHGLISDSPYDLLDYPPAGTIFDSLTRHGISWVNYHPVAGGQVQAPPVRHHSRRMARRRLLSAGRFHHRCAQGIQKDIQFTADVFPVGVRPVHAARAQHRRSSSRTRATGRCPRSASWTRTSPSTPRRTRRMCSGARASRPR